MQFAHEKLEGLDRESVLSTLIPVLRAHGVEGVEILWRSDSRGWVLFLTVEVPGSKEPGEGVTLDLCAEISRDLSAAFDVADVVPGKYRLEVGSPGLERTLYGPGDYERFAGRVAKLKLREPLPDGQRALRGVLRGLDGTGNVLVEAESGVREIAFNQITSGQLVFEWHSSGSRSNEARRRGRSKRPPHRNR
jgi:ribosome maturation factor RimP